MYMCLVGTFSSIFFSFKRIKSQFLHIFHHTEVLIRMIWPGKGVKDKNIRKYQDRFLSMQRVDFFRSVFCAHLVCNRSEKGTHGARGRLLANNSLLFFFLQQRHFISASEILSVQQRMSPLTLKHFTERRYS